MREPDSIDMYLSSQIGVTWRHVASPQTIVCVRNTSNFSVFSKLVNTYIRLYPPVAQNAWNTDFQLHPWVIQDGNRWKIHRESRWGSDRSISHWRKDEGGDFQLAMFCFAQSTHICTKINFHLSECHIELTKKAWSPIKPYVCLLVMLNKRWLNIVVWRNTTVLLKDPPKTTTWKCSEKRDVYPPEV